MNVSYYCQHVLGIGHFHRSMEICKAIARNHPTTLILGGPPVETVQPNIQVLKLPGLQMDHEFNNMVPCDSGLSLDDVKTARKELLFSHFKKDKPDIFVTELYPFGRKAFRFELEPLLAAIRDGLLPNCSCYCSVRDILVEKKTGREKFEQRAVETLNSFFDGILIHADPAIVSLGETFTHLADILIPLHYTGFVTTPQAGSGSEQIRRKLHLASTDKLIVASIGGGNVGSELLFTVIKAFKIFQSTQPAHLQIFCGPYCDEKIFEDLKSRGQDNITVDRFSDRFPAWLHEADLSISMAGYNTCMNLVQAGIPALVYPFAQNREQRLRAERLGQKVPIIVLDETELPPHLLAKKMTQIIATPRYSGEINLRGAEESARHLELWHKEHSTND
jgi:predicted glycosyltransferase